MTIFTVVTGTTGNDLLNGTLSNDLITGLAGNDRIVADAGDDIIDPGAGTNQIDAGAGNDIILIDGTATNGAVRVPANGVDGGTGYDTVVYIGASTNYHVNVVAGGWVEVTNLTTFSRDILANVEHLQFTDTDVFFSAPPADLVLGTAGAELLMGTDLGESIYGFGGNDRLIGGAGNDYLDAGAGTNQIDAGAGADTIVAGQGQNGAVAGTPANGIDGGAGYDTALFMGAAANYHWSNTNGVLRVNNLATGSFDVMINVEHLQFTDSDVWLVPQPVNAPVVSGDVTAAVTEGDAPLAVDALATASDADPMDVLTVVDLPASLPAGVSFDALSQSFVLNGSAAVFDTLAQGETATITVNYGVSDSIHTTAASAVFTVTGVNDAAVVAGVRSGSVTEDASLTATGQLTVTDADHDQSAFAAITTPLTGAYGSLVMDATGLWSYALNNGAAAVQALNAGATLTETLTVYTVDGTATALNITINGADEPMNLITGTNANNTLAGTAGNDQMLGLAGNDKIMGSAGHDLLDGGLGADSLYGDSGDDRIIYDANDKVADGGSGTDTLLVSVAVDANLALSDQVRGDKGAASGFENIDASAATAAVSLKGSAVANMLTGGAGDDLLYGAKGADMLTGGAGADHFVFLATTDSASGGMDVINDFQTGIDVIDLTGIDAIRGGADNAFQWIGAQDFTGVSGQLHYSAATGLLEGDTNGDRVADFQLSFANHAALSAADFLL